MEKAILNIDNLYISQGMNGTYSHKGDLAIDISRLTYLKAPFTGVIKRIYKGCNAIWLESIDKVEYADGTIDYMTIMTLHDNDVSNLKVGQVIKQGTIYYHPGIKGKVTGTHIHLAIGKGKFIGNGWNKNKYGHWCINNQYDITKALFIDKSVKKTKVLYKWKEVPMEEKENISTSKRQKLYLPGSASSWRVYKIGDKPVKGNECGFLKPSKFGGLEYDILGYSMNDVAIIKTRDFGKVQIYIAKGTGAIVK